MVDSFVIGDFAERLEDHPLVKAGEVHEVIETFRGGYLGFKRPIGGEWSPKGWRKVARPAQVSVGDAAPAEARARRPFGWCSPAEAVLLNLTESLSEGLMTDAGLSDDDRSAMRWQLEALGQALDEVREAEKAASSPPARSTKAPWQPTEERVQTGSVAFMQAVRDHEGFWIVDFPLKYLGVHIDTRDGDRFTLFDRDGKPIDGQRVADAMARYRNEFRRSAPTPPRRATARREAPLSAPDAHHPLKASSETGEEG